NRLSKASAFFDNQKLMWINNQYMKQKNSEEIFEMALPFLKEADRVSENPDEAELDWARKLVQLYQPQMSYAAEIIKLSEQFFKDHVEFDEEAQEVLNQEHIPELMTALHKHFTELQDFSPERIKAEIKAVQKETGIKGKKLFMPIRRSEERRVGKEGRERGEED